MSTIPSPTNHPEWCNRKHADDHPVHSVQVGSVDVTDTTSVEVYLFQSGDEADLIKGAADALEGHWNRGGAR